MPTCRRPPKMYWGFKVEYVPVIGGSEKWGGMNCHAAKDLGIYHPSCRVFRIASDQSCKAIRDTILHEYREQKLMEKHPQLSYPEAHRRITRTEKR